MRGMAIGEITLISPLFFFFFFVVSGKKIFRGEKVTNNSSLAQITMQTHSHLLTTYLARREGNVALLGWRGANADYDHFQPAIGVFGCRNDP